MDDDDFGHKDGCLKSDGDWFCTAECSRERRIRNESYKRGRAAGYAEAIEEAVTVVGNAFMESSQKGAYLVNTIRALKPSVKP